MTPRPSGMRSPTPRPRRDAELPFDAPPPALLPRERRLSGLAGAMWAAALGGGRWPAAAAFDRLAAASGPAVAAELAQHGVRVAVVARGSCALTRVGAGVAAAFGLEPGPLLPGLPDGDLAACLHRHALAVQADGNSRSFEAALHDRSGARHFLVRGVVLPLGDPRGALAEIAAVLSWRELLAPGPSLQLLHEIGRAWRSLGHTAAPGASRSTPFG